MNNTYELRFEDRPGYLYAHVRAPHVDEDIARAYLGEIADHCRGSHCSRLMIYRDIPEVLNGGALFFVAADLQAMLQNVRVAFVNPYEQNIEGLEFGNIVASNRGGSFANFATEPEAEAWLLG